MMKHLIGVALVLVIASKVLVKIAKIIARNN